MWNPLWCLSLLFRSGQNSARSSLSRNTRVHLCQESRRCVCVSFVVNALSCAAVHEQQQTTGAHEACSKNQTMRFTA